MPTIRRTSSLREQGLSRVVERRPERLRQGGNRYRGLTGIALCALSKFLVPEAGGQALPAPTGLTTQALSASQIQITWNAVTQASGYLVYRSDQGANPLVSTSARTFTDASGRPATSYTYTVAAADCGGDPESPQSSPVTAQTCPLPTISSFTASAASSTSVALSWGATDACGNGLSGYSLLRDGSALSSFGTGIASYTDSVPAGSTHTYQLLAKDTGNNAATTSATVTTMPSAPGIPQASSVTASSLTVTWTAASGTVTSYAYNVNGGAWTNVGAALSANLTGLTAGSAYTVQVQAINSAGAGPSSSNSLATLPATLGTLTVSGVATTTATVSWAADSGTVTRYEYSLNGGSWVSVGSSLSVSLSGLSTGSSNSVQVHAVDSAGAGAASSTSFWTLPGTPGTPSISSITGTSATASWTAAAGTVTSYAYSLNGGSTWTSVGTALSASLTGLTCVTSYSVLVHASNSGGTGASSSNSFTTQVCTDHPVMTEGNSTNVGFQLSTHTGSMNPTSTSNGHPYQNFSDRTSPATGAYIGTHFAVSGFTSDPGAGWLVSAAAQSFTLYGSSATYSWNPTTGTADWTWVSGPNFSGSGTTTCTIVHH